MNIKDIGDYIYDETIYTPDQLDEVLKLVRPNFRFVHDYQGKRAFNVPCAFDIETTSFWRHNTTYQTLHTPPEGEEELYTKCATMYVWAFGIYGAVIIGRTWDEFTELCNQLVKRLQLNVDKKLIVYVHNLEFDFQFFRSHFNVEKVFALKQRKPIYALTTSGIEFRCSYLLTGYKLETVAKNLQNYSFAKLVGDLDYDLMRHSSTPLTDSELHYVTHDVKIVMACIAEKIKSDGGILKIPLTKTGYVRNYCRTVCFEDDGYREQINSMRLDTEQYRLLIHAFQGGFTHANAFYSGQELRDVTSMDISSSYPTVMVAEKYPMSSPEPINIQHDEELAYNLRHYCCLFVLTLLDVQPTIWHEHYLQQARCYNLANAVVDNGRIVSADSLTTVVTEIDYDIISQTYSWSGKGIGTFYRYKKEYLPTQFVRAVLQLYADKTTLKGVEGKEKEYMNAKEMVNSCYGMSVTNPVREKWEYTDHWLEGDEQEAMDIEGDLLKYNKNKNRFLYYPWGVWVTAYARRNLWGSILETCTDYVYSDTDSNKFMQYDKHKAWFDAYNANIISKINRALDYHGLPYDLASPRTVKGEVKPLGVWELDGHYSRFKTLGAKRYLVEYADGHDMITVSGLAKQDCVDYMHEAAGDDIFPMFSDGMYIPRGRTGKMIHTYIDEPRDGLMTDYLGNTAEYHELTAVHLTDADYRLTVTKEYKDFIGVITKLVNIKE